MRTNMFVFQEKFLELAIDTDGGKILKPKKHKKHKKSKKAAITLDEFLNMNKDVFGEDFDIQGVEEVPTQVISKRLKVKNPPKSKAKLNPEIEKLKKQGIVVKKKPAQNKVTYASNQSIKISPSALKSIRPGVQIKTHNDSVTKLMNQNQIKIGTDRKCSEEKPEAINENEQMLSGNVSDQSDENNVINNGLDPNNMDNELEMDKITKQTTNSPNTESVVNNHLLSEENANDVTDDELNRSESKPFSPESQNKISDSQNTIDSLQKGQLKSDLLNKQDKLANNINSPATEIDDKQLKEDLNKNNFIESQKVPVDSSLSVLKRLSHLLTIKHVNSPKSSPDLKDIEDEIEDFNASPKTVNEKRTDEDQNTNTYQKANQIKNLGKNITIKTADQTQIITSNSDGACDEYKSTEEETEKNVDDSVTIKTDAKSSNSMFVASETGKILKLPTISHNKPTSSKIVKEETELVTTKNYDNTSKIENNKNILKRLPNITARTLKNTPEQTVLANKPSQIKCKTKITKHINEHNVEVFNIEDSDSDDIDNVPNMPDESVKSYSKPKEILKTVNSNKAMKPGQQQIINKNITKTVTKSQTMHNEKQSYHSEESYNKMEYKNVQAIKSVNTKTVSQAASNEKNLAIKNVLKGLGKNIIVKSRTSSPSHSLKSQDNDSQDSYNEAKGDDSDIDSESGNVKITELDENVSDDEVTNNHCEQNVNVQSPNCSDRSEPEDNHEDFNDQDDIESQIAASKLDKSMPNSQTKKSIPLQQTKNVNIKTVNDQKDDSEEESSTAIVPFISKSLGSQISVKPVKQKVNIQNESVKNSKQVTSTNNQMTSSQKISNQTNTVNKAVTVKTFQTATETVIEEITTTVTKTIKTVKQETRNTSQCSSNVVVPQKIQGLKSGEVTKNYQGTKVKHMPPSGLRIKNPTQIRPTIVGSVRPTNPAITLGPVRIPNQLVPTRPKNVARLSTPRMPAIKNNGPSTSNQAKTLKISPNAINSLNAKRTNTEDASGPFSCFKKPKESLIPVSEVPILSNPAQDAVQYSASHINKSSFVSATKTIKGSAVMSQMKSEMSASSQQLSKLSGMSGLKVVKTSQAKQTIVQEKSEVTAPKRTLEAIEKLQKSGLLVKKPRIEEVNESSDHSEHDDDDPPYQSADEEDE